MLFADANRKLIAKYFVPVITDPPWTEKGRERRNPERTLRHAGGRRGRIIPKVKSFEPF